VRGVPEKQQRDPATQWDIVSGVGVTALAVAGGRAMESQREDRLVHDPYADALVRSANPDVPVPGVPQLDGEPADAELEPHWQEMTNYIGVRSRFFDEFFAGAGKAGIRQAVILASGLDTRPHRLDWPQGTAVFEIDQPLVLQYKDQVLSEQNAEPTAEHHPVPIDLRDDWPTALLEAGFDRTRPTAWLAEGLLPYLPAEAEAQLLRTIHDFSAPGSRVAIESVSGNRDNLVSPRMQELSEQYGIDLGSLFNTESRPDPASALADSGWDVQRLPTAQIANEYGRDLTGFAQSLSRDQHFLTAALPG
jgi:methyltransferase (TIGR00027 family)